MELLTNLLRSNNKVLLSNLHNVPPLLPPNFTVGRLTSVPVPVQTKFSTEFSMCTADPTLPLVIAAGWDLIKFGTRILVLRMNKLIRTRTVDCQIPPPWPLVPGKSMVFSGALGHKDLLCATRAVIFEIEALAARSEQYGYRYSKSLNSM